MYASLGDEHLHITNNAYLTEYHGTEDLYRIFIDFETEKGESVKFLNIFAAH